MVGGKSWPSWLRPSQIRRGAAALAILFAGTTTAAAQITELPRQDSTAGDFFGAAVAIDGDHVIVGATGIDTCGRNSGTAYIYERLPGSESWHETAELVPGDCEEGIFFGRSVDVSGRFAAVAASREFFSEEAPNAVYVFEKDTMSGDWLETAKLTGGSASEEGAFATSVSMDGARVLVTTSGDPAAGRFGGAAYVFERSDSTGAWHEAARLHGNGNLRDGVFGTEGVLEDSLIAVAASTYFRNKPGSVYIFELKDSEWIPSDRVGKIDDFFISIDVDGGRVIAGESKAMRDESGSATIFEQDQSGTWRAAHVLRPEEPYDAGAFGSVVALDDEYALVVGFDEQLGLDFNIDRVVFVFRHEAASDTWRQVHVIDVGKVALGAGLDVDGRYAAIGSASENAPGSVYIVRLPEYDW